MKTFSPALIGFLRGLGVVVLTAFLTYAGNATNLTFLSPGTALIVAAIALFADHALSQPSTALFGSVNVG
jgi:hypothetical protein